MHYTSISIFLAILVISCNGAEQTANTTDLVSEEDMSNEAYWKDATLVWSDEFEGNELSSENWKFETGDHGWGNNEWQNYVADSNIENSNIEISNGTLKIIAKKTGAGQKVGDYTSTRLNSKQSFLYGRMEIRAKIPDDKGKGIWPALWMLGENITTIGWPACGEIDIMEYVSFDPNIVHFSIHSTANNHTNNTQVTSEPVELETIEEKFHNYGVLWTEQKLQFYIDEVDSVKLTFNRPSNFNDENWPFNKPFYFLLNMAVGGNWGGQRGVDDSIFPSEMEVDYVRVYQR
ncbi:MAG: glycoside hydrolase family 16 protein [Bacteroidota bacterium]